MQHFTKMQSLGNDFVIIDATRQPVKLSKQLVTKLADRHLGIGFDQLLVIESSKKKDFDFNYRIFNADGSEVSQCGNGARCVARYIYDKNLSNKKELVFSTLKGKIIVQRDGINQFSVNMGIPDFDPKKIPFKAKRIQNSYELSVKNQKIHIGAVGLGNPHAIIQVKNINNAPVAELGKKIEQHPKFPEHANVSFMQVKNRNKILLRVFERGVGETLACGSAACAAVVYGQSRQKLAQRVKVVLPGGNLEIFWKGNNTPVWMKGPAEFVFNGTLSLIK